MKKIRGLRWWVIALVGVATVINYIDRSTLPVMWPGISKELGLSKSGYATVLTCFMAAYGLSQGLSGMVYDRIGTRLGFVCSILLWSVAEACNGLSRSLGGFGVFRSFEALGEAGNWPGAAKVIAEWFPIRERALGQGIFNTGAALGAIVSPPIVAALYVHVGWRWTFAAVGAVGPLWILPWWWLNRAQPRDHPRITEEEKALIVAGQQTAIPVAGADRPLGFREILRYRQSWAVIASRCFIDPIWWMFVSWLPIYLSEHFGFNVSQIGLFSWVPYVGAAAGSLSGGWFSGFLIGRGVSVNVARKGTIAAGGALMVGAFISTALAGGPIAALLSIAAVLFGFQVAINNIQTLPSDFFSGKSVGVLAGLGGTGATLGTLVTIQLIPRLTSASYTPFFIMGALLVPCGVAALFLIGGEIKRVSLKPADGPAGVR